MNTEVAYIKPGGTARISNLEKSVCQIGRTGNCTRDYVYTAQSLNLPNFVLSFLDDYDKKPHG